MNHLFIFGCGVGFSLSLIIFPLILYVPWEYIFAFIGLIISLVSYYQEKIKSYLGSLLLKCMMSIMFETTESKENDLSIDKNIATINYTHNKKEYKFYLPYDSIAAKTRSKRVFAIKEDGSEINITQQPGLPYLLTCNDLNVLRIEVRGRDQTVLKIYQNDDKIIV